MPQFSWGYTLLHSYEHKEVKNGYFQVSVLKSHVILIIGDAFRSSLEHFIFLYCEDCLKFLSIVWFPEEFDDKINWKEFILLLFLLQLA